MPAIQQFAAQGSGKMIAIRHPSYSQWPRWAKAKNRMLHCGHYMDNGELLPVK
jgi:hypothetical protein